MRIVADIETDGLLDSLTTMHSLVARDADTGELLLSCTDNPRGRAMGYRPISEGLELLSDAETLYFHNGIRFDIPAIQQLYPCWTYRGKLMDTLVASAFRFAHIAEKDYDLARKGRFNARLAGSHSLEAWGHRLGVFKGDYSEWCKAQGIDPWAEWRPEMQVYCEGDTDTGRALVLHLRKAGLPPEAVDIEHRLAWYLAQQERNGWPFDIQKATELHGVLAQRREELSKDIIEHFGWWYESGGTTTPKRTMQRKDGLITEGAPYTRLKRVEMTPTSRHHIYKRLIKVYGWVPTEFTKTGQPRVDDDTLSGLPYPITNTLVEYLLVNKRLGQISEGEEAWLKHMTRDDPHGGKRTGMYHVHGRVIQNKAITHRAAHAKPNLAQVPKVGSPFGEECRSLFTVPNGWVQVGADASSLELRCLAHYMAKYDGGVYGKAVVEGKNEDQTDVHSINCRALFGTWSKELRDTTKTWVYANLYGAGFKKLGSIEKPHASAEIQEKTGKRRKKAFLKGLPALKSLSEAVQAAARAKGHLRLPDGRRVYIRHQHAALNSLLQGAGAIICKAWIVEFSRRLEERFGPQGWTGKWAALGWIHDEVQLAVRPEIAPEVQEILVDSIRWVGTHFNWRCPLGGEAKVGQDWAQTH